MNKIHIHQAGIAEYGTGTDENGFTRIKINFSDQKEVRRLIHKERRVEFVGEGVRYHDLRRWKTAHYGIGNLNEQGENPDWGVNGPVMDELFAEPNILIKETTPSSNAQLAWIVFILANSIGIRYINQK